MVRAVVLVWEEIRVMVAAVAWEEMAELGGAARTTSAGWRERRTPRGMELIGRGLQTVAAASRAAGGVVEEAEAARGMQARALAKALRQSLAGIGERPG